MCQSCSAQKITRQYSKGGLVVQVLGKPPRPCASPRSSTTPPCSPRAHSPSPKIERVGKVEDPEECFGSQVQSPRCAAVAAKAARRKMFAAIEPFRLGDDEMGEAVDDESTVSTPRQSLTLPSDYASRYRTNWC